MNIDDVQSKADVLRSEAKALLNVAVGIPSEYGSSAVDRFVDCIISCAMLEVAINTAKVNWEIANLRKEAAK